jgi:N-acetylmuramic acid 6-phosphate etherase
MVTGIIAGGYKAMLRSVECVEDDVNAGISEIDTNGVEARDVVIGIAASGTTPFVRAALGRAQTLGTGTVLVSCSEPPQVLRDTCDVCITLLVGPEVVTGSTRLKAGTATKLTLNMLTTGAMVRLGKTYGNLMVDLNSYACRKLTDRAARVVAEMTGLKTKAALRKLHEARGRAKTAILMHRSSVSRAEAERLLARCGGRVRECLDTGVGGR